MNVHSSGDKAAHRLRDRFREETNRAVLGAAEAVFAAHGLSGVSMAQIAERAGVAVGTLYNHFRDRETLLAAVIDQRRGDLVARIDRRLEQLEGRPFREQLQGYLDAIFEHFEEHRAFLRVAFEHGNWRKCDEIPQALFQRIVPLLKQGHREKVLRADPHHSFAVMLLGTIKSMFLRERYGAPPIENADAVREIVDFFLRAAGR
jgi:AcrR family transcriptional regulator